MTQDEIKRIADAVHDRLMNGPIKELQESVDGLSETFGPVARKVDDLHRWQREMNQDMTDIREHLGI